MSGNLKAVWNDTNGFCGPAAISIVAGIPTSEAARRIREITGKPSVHGVRDADLIGVLSGLGFAVTESNEWRSIPKRQRPTLAKWISARSDPSALYVVVAASHYQVIQDDEYCCGKTVLPVSIRNPFVPLRARVAAAYKIGAVAP